MGLEKYESQENYTVYSSMMKNAKIYKIAMEIKKYLLTVSYEDNINSPIYQEDSTIKVLLFFIKFINSQY